MQKMKAAVYRGAKEINIENIEKPKIGVGEALIKVTHAGICGTDMMIYLGKHPRARNPLVMGHEFSGIIEEIDGGTEFSKGERVVVEPTISCGVCEACLVGQNNVCRTLELIGIDRNGGFAQYTKVKVNRLHHLPKSLSNEMAALVEPVAVAVHTIRLSKMKIGDSIAILGAGPIGLLIGQVAKRSGAKNIFISDISPYRIQKIKEMGFTAINANETDVVKEIYNKTSGVGVDVVFEVAGSQITTDQMVNIVKIQGQIVVVSVYKNSPTIDLATMHFKELSLITTRCYSSADYQTAINLMTNNQIDVASIISHRLPLNDLTKGFLLMENPEKSLKVLIYPQK